eukprot:GEMP01036606.1.p1 GENE.GEMP01036606.1~~GEMP01036606.1.p1  ORF type:complete len:282 (+),score=52.57 GEMP01036606.1:58-903(+)
MLLALSEVRIFNGVLTRFKHKAESLGGLDAIFATYVPIGAKNAPCIYWLSGLTCTDENFSLKCTPAFERASELGIVLVLPDTSPRGAGIAGEDDSWDFGTGAGFYVDATQEPWKKHYNMYTYVTKELYELVNANLPVDSSKVSISGHSMGGNGALMIALRNPQQYKSASAFAPISNPSVVPWGEKAFSNYLGPDKETWKQYDTVELLKRGGHKMPICVDQGAKDTFLVGDVNQLQTESLKAVLDKTTPTAALNYREGFDHSYHFVSSFIKNHLNFHMEYLK